MVRRENILNVPVIWRGNKFVLEMNSGASLNDFGEELQKLSDVRANTMRLIVPQSSTKGSKLLMPFSEEHSHLRLQDIAMPEGKPLRMMGVSEEEVDQILESAKANLRIAGFEEEEKRMKQLTSYKPQLPLKLPPGPYIFCDFRTLTLPGVQLNPPPSEALKRMHMLAADPGIVAIMNKHRWRVGVMTEMAPVGYVGISPKCILGLNKDHGEEISLRLRTDDLKGFRKYESIKKTLLHELAHMVYSEHDANFYALDKQLNQEAATLDWTRSKSHTLTGLRPPEQYDVDVDFESKSSLPYKLGGNTSNWPADARSASVAAASSRLLVSENMNTTEEEKIILEKNQITLEPDPDDSETTGSMELKPHPEVFIERTRLEPDPDDAGMIQVVPVPKTSSEEPNPYDLGVIETNSQPMQIDNNMRGIREHDTEPDPDDVESKSNMPSNIRMFNEGEFTEPDPDEILANKVVHTEPDEPDLEDEEALRIQDPARVFCNRLATAVDNVLAEVSPSEQGTVLQTLVKIIRNVIEHPDDIKYKRLRKANRLFQTTVAKYKASMEILALIGFNEDVIFDETGKAETYLVLKRDDPGLLWLAKSFLETCI